VSSKNGNCKQKTAPAHKLKTATENPVLSVNHAAVAHSLTRTSVAAELPSPITVPKKESGNWQ
jgi:hypothetical protein